MKVSKTFFAVLCLEFVLAITVLCYYLYREQQQTEQVRIEANENVKRLNLSNQAYLRKMNAATISTTKAE